MAAPKRSRVDTSTFEPWEDKFDESVVTAVSNSSFSEFANKPSPRRSCYVYWGFSRQALPQEVQEQRLWFVRKIPPFSQTPHGQSNSVPADFLNLIAKLRKRYPSLFIPPTSRTATVSEQYSSRVVETILEFVIQYHGDKFNLHTQDTFLYQPLMISGPLDITVCPKSIDGDSYETNKHLPKLMIEVKNPAKFDTAPPQTLMQTLAVFEKGCAWTGFSDGLRWCLLKRTAKNRPGILCYELQTLASDGKGADVLFHQLAAIIASL